MHYKVITDNQSLNTFCAQAKQQSFIIVDTEFVRTRTLNPQLGLIQLNDGIEVVLVDPLAITDWQAFRSLLTDANIVKVLHSCSEDLDAFNTALGVMPTPLFDTQFCAHLLGMGNSLGYAALVEKLCGVALDKGESRTDWLARPLSEKQLSYAANDVIYLRDVYLQLKQAITQAGREAWVFLESETLIAKKQASLPTEFSYLTIKNNWRLNIKQLFVLKALAAWRVEVAKQKDIALNFVLREAAMVEVAKRCSVNKAILKSIDDILPQTIRRYGDDIMKTVAIALQAFEKHQETSAIAPIQRLIDFPKYKKMLAELKFVSAAIAAKNGLEPEVVASKKQLEQFLKWQWFSLDETALQGLLPDILSGWRKELFEPYLTTIFDLKPISNSKE